MYSGGAPMAHAVVAILTPQGDGARWVTGVIADNAGRYRATVPPGTYMLMPTWPGYFTDQSLGALVTLTNGMSATNDLFLTNGIVTISGTVYNAGNSNGLGGVLMPIEGGNFFAITFTDTNGLFTAGVAPASWKLKVEANAVAQRAYVAPQNKIQVDTTTGSVAGVSIALSKGNALIYGTFTNASRQVHGQYRTFCSGQFQPVSGQRYHRRQRQLLRRRPRWNIPGTVILTTAIRHWRDTL